MPNFGKISQSVAKILTFFSIFQDGGRPPSWICLGHIWTTYSEYLGVSITLQIFCEILLATGADRVEIHQHSKLCQNRSIGCSDINIFSIFQDGGRRHLGLSNSQNFIG